MEEQHVTSESRLAIARAKFFLRMAILCPAHARVDFEAFLEASIVFGRTEMHRLKAMFGKHPEWAAWWYSLNANPSVNFLRKERDRILKEESTKVGQRIFLPFSSDDQSYTKVPANPSRAYEFYYFGEDASVPATTTVHNHLIEIERLRDLAEKIFQ